MPPFLSSPSMQSQQPAPVLFMIITIISSSSRHVGAQTPQYDQTLHGLPAMYYSWNPNCADMGYDFGYKMEGCVPGTNIRFDSLERTRGTSCDSASNNYNLDGTFDLDCFDSDDDGEWHTASITPSPLSLSSSLVVMMKGGRGGVIYSALEADSTYTLDVGSRKGISHLEFCFFCSDLEEQAEQEQEEASVVVTNAPTPNPTARIPDTSAPTMALPTIANPIVPTTYVPTLETLPTQCFHCGTDSFPPKNQKDDGEEQSPQVVEEIDGTVTPPAKPATEPPLPETIELISAQVYTRSGVSASVILPGWYDIFISVGTLLLLALMMQ